MFRLIAASLLLSASAQAYITTNGDRTRWQRQPRPGLVACSADLPAERCRAAIDAAFHTWSNVTGVSLEFPALIDGAADITVAFVADRPELVGVLGVTTTTTDGDAIVAALVELNDDFTWAHAGPRGTFDVQSTATHEIGHALGLGHSQYSGATMYWHYRPHAAVLGEDDRRAIRFLYADAPGVGLPCDSCVVPDDCLTGICLQRLAEGGRAYCARPCGDGCPADERCVALLSGGEACIPADGSCGLVSDLPDGVHCWGPTQCAGELRCVVYSNGARCAGACDSPADCGDGAICALDPVDLPRACLPPGGAELGGACAWATECASGVCLPDGICGAWCRDGECAAGWVCEMHAHWPDRPPVCVPPPPEPDAAVPADASPVDASPIDSLVDARPDVAWPADGAADDPRADGGPDMDDDMPRASATDGCQQGSDQPMGVLVLLAVMIGCFLVVRRRRD